MEPTDQTAMCKAVLAKMSQYSGGSAEAAVRRAPLVVNFVANDGSLLVTIGERRYVINGPDLVEEAPYQWSSSHGGYMYGAYSTATLFYREAVLHCQEK